MKPAMRAIQAVVICTSLLFAPVVFAQGDRLPEPDFDAIARMAQRVESGKSYVATLPKRRKECQVAAVPYFDSGVTSTMAQGGFIVRQCYAAMLVKMAELYYRPDAFGPGGMPALLDKLQGDIGRLYYGMYQGRNECLEECGSMATLSEIADSTVEIERAVRIMALLHVPNAESKEWSEAWDRAEWPK